MKKYVRYLGMALATCGNGHGWTIPAIYIIFCLFIVSIIFATFCRRSNYELFYVSHCVFFPLLVVAFYHSWRLWQYGGIGVALWVFNKGVSRCLSPNPGSFVVELTALPGMVSRLTVAKADGSSMPHHRAGQFAMLNVPRVNVFQWHPFTIASSPDAKAWTFHIKAMGQGSWTQDLYLRALDTRCTTNVELDGPFGAPETYLHRPEVPVAGAKAVEAKTLLFIAGGIGVTPVQSIVNEMLEAHRKNPLNLGSVQSVVIAWSVPSAELFSLWDETISAVQNDRVERNVFSFRLFVSHRQMQKSRLGEAGASIALELLSDSQRKEHSKLISDSKSYGGMGDQRALAAGLQYKHEHLSVDGLIRELRNDAPLQVFSCGPPGMTDEARATVYSLSKEGLDVSFHSTEFLL